MDFSRTRLRGDAPQLNSPVLDRRTWPRGEVLAPEARLSWRTETGERAVDARLVNLSRGGAGLLVREVPPPDAALRLVLFAEGGQLVEGMAVATREEPDRGWTFLHMRFRGSCPDRVLDRLLGYVPEPE